jgi:hypothetical protein
MKIRWNKRQVFRVSVLLDNESDAREFVVKDDGWQIRVENVETGNLISAISTPGMREGFPYGERQPDFTQATIIVDEFLREHFKGK